MSFLGDSVQRGTRFVIISSLFISIVAIQKMAKMPPLEKLEHYSGKVVDIKRGRVYTKDSSEYKGGILILLEDINRPFGSWYTEDINVISRSVEKSDSVTIWLYDKKGTIAQLVVNKDKLIPYTRYSPVDIGFAIGGFILFVFSLWMAIKYPEGVSERIAEEKANKAKGRER